MRDVFGIPAGKLNSDMSAGSIPQTENRNEAGGRAIFIPHPSPQILEEVIASCLPVRDVAFAEPAWEVGIWADYQRGLKLDSPEWMKMQKPGYEGALTYTHKVKNGRDVYFFANSSERKVETMVTLRGSKTLRLWDPHTGKDGELISRKKKLAGASVTEFELTLPATYSLFVIGD
jgi:hypothetical protein